MKCQKCGAEVDDNALFCGECGSKIDQEAPVAETVNGRICKSCGAALQEGAMFCGVCGERIKAEEDRAGKLQKAAAEQLDRKLPGMIEENLPELADALSKEIAPKVKKSIESRLREWRDDKSREKETLMDVLRCVRLDCSNNSFAHLYDKAIKTWMNETLGGKIADLMEPVCQEHGVRKLEAEDCKAVNLPDLKIEPEIEWVLSCLNVDGVVVHKTSIICCIVVIIISAAQAVYEVNGVWGKFFFFLLAIPFYGMFVSLIHNWWRKISVGYSEKMAFLKARKLIAYSRPERFELVKDTLSEALVNNRLQAEIRSTILREENREKITGAVSACLKEQVEKYIQELK